MVAIMMETLKRTHSHGTVQLFIKEVRLNFWRLNELFKCSSISIK